MQHVFYTPSMLINIQFCCTLLFCGWHSRYYTLILQVEFPPTFEEQPMSEQWSWDQNPINLTCIATAIPNATITWWYRDREINREIIDRNYRVFGHGPRSDLIVTPLDLQYYGRYTCKAINPHGEAFYEIGMYASVENYVEKKKYVGGIAI